MALVTLVAGCNSPSPEPLPSSLAAHIKMQDVLLSDCTGGGTRIDVPEGMLTTPVPPGWEGKNGLPTTVTLIALFCDHVSLGDFERGPIRLVLESHEKFNAPDNCREGDYTYLNILTRIVVDDPEIAAAIQDELTIPTSTGNFTWAEDGTSALKTVRVGWRVDGSPESWFQVGRVENAIQDSRGTYRYVWAAGENLGLVDMKLDARQTQFEPTAALASFSSPMLIASTGLPYVIGVGVVDEEVFPEGTFQFFEGYECANPLDSWH